MYFDSHCFGDKLNINISPHLSFNTHLLDKTCFFFEIEEVEKTLYQIFLKKPKLHQVQRHFP